MRPMTGRPKTRLSRKEFFHLERDQTWNNDANNIYLSFPFDRTRHLYMDFTINMVLFHVREKIKTF